LCFSHNYIEQYAYEMSKKIWESSSYKPIRLEFAGGTSLEFKNQPNYWDSPNNEMGNTPVLITKIILESSEGKLFSVEPNDNGLRFAKGEITYKEYKRLQKKEDVNGAVLYIVIIFVFFTLMSVLVKFVL
jgi:hypothetical protein